MPSKHRATAPAPNADAQQRAARADELLQDPLLQECFDTVIETYTDAWQNSAYQDVEGREKAYRMTQAVEALRGQLASVAVNGRIERERVKQTVSPASKS